MLVLMLTTIVATSIIVSLFYEGHITKLNDKLFELENLAVGICTACSKPTAHLLDELCRRCTHRKQHEFDAAVDVLKDNGLVS